MPTKRTRPTEKVEKQPEQESKSSARPQTSDDYMAVWMGYAKEMGDSAGDFVKKFGEEQQKNYEQWMAAVQDGSKPRPSVEDMKEVGERFQQWSSLAQEISEKIKEVFTTGTDLQKEFFAAWSQASSQNASSPEDAAKGLSELAQKFWTGLAGNLYQKSLTSMRPNMSVEEFIKNQEEMLKDYSENFKKLTYTYFTSPPFVSLFGQTLDSTLEMQKLFSQEGGIMSYLSGIPTKKDLAQLQEMLMKISSKVQQIEEKIR
jgi:gas vesicle protein